jgi:hypothetical protein
MKHFTSSHFLPSTAGRRTPGISGAPRTLMIKILLGARPLHAFVSLHLHGI